MRMFAVRVEDSAAGPKMVAKQTRWTYDEFLIAVAMVERRSSAHSRLPYGRIGRPPARGLSRFLLRPSAVSERSVGVLEGARGASDYASSSSPGA